jgi:hypothetical protein
MYCAEEHADADAVQEGLHQDAGRAGPGAIVVSIF